MNSMIRPHTVRTISRYFREISMAVDLLKDWHTDQEVLRGLRRIGCGCDRRQIRHDRQELRALVHKWNLLPPQYFNYQLYDGGMDTESVVTLVLFRLLCRERSQKQAILNVHYYRIQLEEVLNVYYDRQTIEQWGIAEGSDLAQTAAV